MAPFSPKMKKKKRKKNSDAKPTLGQDVNNSPTRRFFCKKLLISGIIKEKLE